MQLDSNGLPKPGRDLDATVWEVLGHRTEWWWSYHTPDHGWIQQSQGDVEDMESWLQREVRAGRITRQPWYWSDPEARWRIVPEVSTTHAFFQVMDAVGGMWSIDEQDKQLVLSWQERRYGEYRSVRLPSVCHYPDREHAYAHAVCAILKQAHQKGEAQVAVVDLSSSEATDPQEVAGIVYDALVGAAESMGIYPKGGEG